MKQKSAVLVFLFLCGCLSAETMYICAQKAQLKESTFFFSKTVATLLYGDRVDVLSSDGKWIKVSAPDKGASAKEVSGWLQSSALTKKKIVSRGNRVSADAKELALAGKGFSEEVENEYKKSGKADYAAVDKMEDAELSSSDLFQFILEGKLNGAEE
ncbi:hypothetical protein [Treponema parvum]|uniref:hypothetical protein n=1 Tax=Treponema parvum TaxID=138851 RepID=UPI001AEBA796|nr:hypothetical protein [Treponema parvum]QTQ15591.1 hypothetical protein HXT04_02110 [Treponema parvum]